MPPLDADRPLTGADLREVSSADAVAALFARLGYDTSARRAQTAAALGLGAETVQRKLRRLELIASQEGGALQVYLVQLDSVTVAAVQAICRALRDRVGNFLLVFVHDYAELSFVLVERDLPRVSPSANASPRVTVRPRFLDVDRRDPSAVALRVLRRFSYTEADADAQYDKLRSAYEVAEWAEPFFNNRALFADYYLSERLPSGSEWREDAKPALRRFSELCQRARERFVGAPETRTRADLIEPALSALGFTLRPVRPGEASPDYLLADSSGQTRAVCLAYLWDRNLDGRDDTRDAERPSDNPGARVVSVLDPSIAPWAIVTNGKLWRLYRAGADSRATNYYEIDLEETLAAPDLGTAFRYFWHFFRAASLVPRPVVSGGVEKPLTFLDELVEESAAFARRLGDRLKDRVFAEVFPSLARGFITYRRRNADAPADLPPDQLEAVFHGTLVLLYRLLFFLYAESRDLLPVRETRGYWEKSLSRLKAEIAAKAGPIDDEVADHVDRAYAAGPAATGLYDRLSDLARILDRGDPALNSPLYDGGLFLTEPDPEDPTPEAVAARFLLANKVPDRYLAFALDRLARAVDEKTHALAPIDYKSLGVRQLGSIYEGLLEFRLRIAPEKMAIVKGNKTEEILPYAEAVKDKRAILTEGRGTNARERTLPRGTVYLENDRRERRATGSYYTPDDIVKYVVERAVGPVLREHLERLRPELRAAQKAYADAKARQAAFRARGMSGDDPEKVAFDPRWRRLVDDLFAFRVLDPAMGSGHFLVEAVDYVADRAIDFLNSFPWNPVLAQMRQTREAILAEMERQKVTIDPAKLTDVNLLKRHVLKRCVYGVDLNPMAVELAKVSLWLHCFTLGAPLSFLDHHLKRGNSLIGTTVDAVEAELTKQNQGHVGDLFGGPFQGLLNATGLIEELSAIPDVTVDESRRSRGLWSAIEESLGPYQAALNIWVSRFFGNRRAKEYLTLVGGDYLEQIRAKGAGLSPEYREVIAIAAELQKTRRFFHWDLEFPEAFLDVRNHAWKPADQRGFNAVIGNPPYDELSQHYSNTDNGERSYISESEAFRPFSNGRTNLFRLFIIQGVAQATQGGAISFIVPMALLADDFSLPTREHLLLNHRPLAFEVFPQKDDPQDRVFSEAKLSTCIFVVRKDTTSAVFRVRTHPGRDIRDQSPSYTTSGQELQAVFPSHICVPTVSSADWDVLKRVFGRNDWPRLGQIAHVYVGEIFDNAPNKKYLSDDPVGPLIVRGANVDRYLLRKQASQGKPRYLRQELFDAQKQGGSKLRLLREERIGLQRGAAVDNWRRLIACLVPSNTYCFDTVLLIVPKQVNIRVLLALINSDLWEWRFRCTSTTNHVNEYELADLALPPSLIIDSLETRTLVDMVKLTLASSSTAVRRSNNQTIPPTSPDSLIDEVIFSAYGLTKRDAEVVRSALTR